MLSVSCLACWPSSEIIRMRVPRTPAVNTILEWPLFGMLAHIDFKTVPGSCYSGQAKWPIVSSGGFREGSWGVPGVPWNPSFEGLPLKFYAQTYYIHHAHTGVIQKSRFHSSNNPQLGLALSHPTETISEFRNPKFCLGGGACPQTPQAGTLRMP